MRVPRPARFHTTTDVTTGANIDKELRLASGRGIETRQSQLCRTGNLHLLRGLLIFASAVYCHHLLAWRTFAGISEVSMRTLIFGPCYPTIVKADTTT